MILINMLTVCIKRMMQENLRLLEVNPKSYLCFCFIHIKNSFDEIF